tara:strand:+ start:1773 stop:2015 length:243 start_codon:yes stop_codon:yes gene_type:complete
MNKKPTFVDNLAGGGDTIIPLPNGHTLVVTDTSSTTALPIIASEDEPAWKREPFAVPFPTSEYAPEWRIAPRDDETEPRP